MADFMYQVDGGGEGAERYLPAPLTAGPWSSESQHGGPVAALLARGLERTEPLPDLQTVRVTVELLRPVPLTPLTIRSSVDRPGRKVRFLEAAVEADGRVVAQARALQIRSVPVDVGMHLPEPVPPVPADGGPISLRHAQVGFGHAVEFRFVSGGWDEEGPAVLWGRLLADVVAGETPSPLQRVMALADFGNGISRVVPFESHLFINPDLTVSLARVPDGEWIGLDIVSRLSPLGYGHAESRVFDRNGTVGRAVQSLYVERR